MFVWYRLLPFVSVCVMADIVCERFCGLRLFVMACLCVPPFVDVCCLEVSVRACDWLLLFVHVCVVCC